jgi:hypothetical protein
LFGAEAAAPKGVPLSSHPSPETKVSLSVILGHERVFLSAHDLLE